MKLASTVSLLSLRPFKIFHFSGTHLNNLLLLRAHLWCNRAKPAREATIDVIMFERVDTIPHFGVVRRLVLENFHPCTVFLFWGNNFMPLCGTGKFGVGKSKTLHETAGVNCSCSASGACQNEMRPAQPPSPACGLSCRFARCGIHAL